MTTAHLFKNSIGAKLLADSMDRIDYPTAHGVTLKVDAGGMAFKVTTVDEAGFTGFNIVPSAAHADTVIEVRLVNGFDRLLTIKDGDENDLTDNLMAIMLTLPEDAKFQVNGVYSDLLGVKAQVEDLMVWPKASKASRLWDGIKVVAGALAVGAVAVGAYTLIQLTTEKR